jgi:hypothetical protein
MLINTRKPLDKGYLDRLAQYANHRIEEEGTAAAWARKLGVYRTTPLFWRDRKLTEVISEKNLEALAADRGEKPEETRAWLEGRVEKRSEFLDKLGDAPPEELAEVLSFCLRRLNQLAKDGCIPLVQCGASRGTVSLEESEERRKMPTDYEFIEIGSKKHIKLKAILVETLRIKKMPLDDIEAIADAMGYDRSQRLRFNAGLEMLEGFLTTDKGTLGEVGDYHLVYLAGFCHRLIKYYESPTFHARCDEVLKYDGDVEQLLSDITRNGALIG